MKNYIKVIHHDEIKDEKGNVIQEGTVVNAELLNKYENMIQELVNKVNELEKR